MRQSKDKEMIYCNIIIIKIIIFQWGSKAFDNLLIVPPGSGIVHQVNLEYLSRTVFADKVHDPQMLLIVTI